MRSLLFAVLALPLLGGAAPIGFEIDTARPGGTYLVADAADAEACSRTCEEDGLCMAWTFSNPRRCELKAAVTRPEPHRGASSGLASRAPDFARAEETPEAPQLAAAEPERASEAEPIAAAQAAASASDLAGGPQDERLQLRSTSP